MAFLERGLPCGNKHPEVHISSGHIVGERLTSNVVHFGGIPYARPPVGELRWKRPQNPVPWNDVLDCTSNRSKERKAWPVQSVSEEDLKKGVFISEDCLHLNIWAPATKPKKKVPVFVWIYGGGLVGGSMYEKCCDGRAYAERGLVFCSFNYRVGAMGFLAPQSADHNCGLWDQVRALHWIRSEIRAFGGDPTNITICGQSAGADSVYWLNCSVHANWMYDKAIIMSPASFTITPDQADELAGEFCKELEKHLCIKGLDVAPLSTLQAISGKDILHVQEKGKFVLNPCTGPGWRIGAGECPVLSPPQTKASISPTGLFCMPEPVTGWPLPVACVDGVFLADKPLNELKRGVARHLSVIVGSNKEEDSYAPNEPDAYGARITGGRKEVVKRVEWELAGADAHARALQAGKTAQDLNVIANDIVKAYECEFPNFHGNADSPEQWLQDMISSDFAFSTAANLIAQRLWLHAPHSIWKYQFEGYNRRGSFHARELCLCSGAQDPPPLGSKEVRKDWLDSWTAFAKSGNPNTPDMNGAWTNFIPQKHNVLFWDGHEGWWPGSLAERIGLAKTSDVWEELWGIQPCGTDPACGHGMRLLKHFRGSQVR